MILRLSAEMDHSCGLFLIPKFTRLNLSVHYEPLKSG